MAYESLGRVQRDAVLERLVANLKNIAGSPTYYSNLGGRVYRRLRPPEELEKGEFPCVFVVEDDQDTPVENEDREGVKAMIHAVLVGYVRETSEGPYTATAPGEASDLLDDQFKVILSDPYLGNLINAPILFTRCGAFTGLDPLYSFTRIEIDIPYHFYEGDLGPSP